MSIETCVECGKEYGLTEIGSGMPGTKEKEDICCPYCGNTITRRSNGAFRTHKLETPSKQRD